MPKKLIRFLLSLAFFAPLFVHSQCVSDENNVYAFVYNGNSYEIVKEKLSWADAAACAVERGGYLASINDKPENDSVFAHVLLAGISNNATIAPDGGPSDYLWIGGNDLATEGTWIWDGENDGTGNTFWEGDATGMAVNNRYENWGNNEPDNFTNQDGLGMALNSFPNGDGGDWNDLKADNDLFYIIEYNGLSTATIAPTWKSHIKLYPNPATTMLYLEIPQEIRLEKGTTVVLMDAMGRVVKVVEPLVGTTKIDIQRVPAGIYFFSIREQEGESLVIPVIIK